MKSSSISQRVLAVQQSLHNSVDSVENASDHSLSEKSIDNKDSHVSSTAQGTLMSFLGKESSVLKENKKLSDEVSNLNDKLNNYKDSKVTKLINPTLITPSKWVNRHTSAFDSDDFQLLKNDIEYAGGNTQAIKIRPIPESNPQKYEIVFGHRRHAACLQLGIDVLATIENLNDVDLFSQMDRENRCRADLRPYEQGEMYRRALDDGLFSSAREMAIHLGVSNALISRSIEVARLPREVLDAFKSPNDIQYRWATDITSALKNSYTLVIDAANKIISERNNSGKILQPLEIFERLSLLKKTKVDPRVININSKISMHVKTKNNKLNINLVNLTGDQIKKVEDIIIKTLSTS